MMALRFMDSFDTYDTSQMLRKWSAITNTTIASASPRNGVGYAQQTGFLDILRKELDDQASWVVGFGFRATSIGNVSDILRFWDVAAQQALLRVQADGKLEIQGGGAVTDGVSTLSLSANVWYFIECKITIANSIGAGTCVVTVNGDTWITVATGEDLQVSTNAFAQGISFTGMNGGVTSFDDLYICDGTGPDCNDLLGDSRIQARLPDGNGNVNQFTGSDADSTDNYLLVDEVPADDDTTYVEDSTTGNQDLYTFGDLSGSPTTIHGVQLSVVAKKDDAGARSLKRLVRSGGTTYDGTDAELAQGTYDNHEEIFELDPDTSAAWTESGINAAEFGVETV